MTKQASTSSNPLLDFHKLLVLGLTVLMTGSLTDVIMFQIRILRHCPARYRQCLNNENRTKTNEPLKRETVGLVVVGIKTMLYGSKVARPANIKDWAELNTKKAKHQPAKKIKSGSPKPTSICRMMVNQNGPGDFSRSTTI